MKTKGKNVHAKSKLNCSSVALPTVSSSVSLFPCKYVHFFHMKLLNIFCSPVIPVMAEIGRSEESPFKPEAACVLNPGTFL